MPRGRRRDAPSRGEASAGASATAGEPWWGLADALLEREARRTRLRRGVPADSLAGLRVDDAEVDRLLVELTGGGEISPAAEEDLDAIFRDVVEDERKIFTEALDGEGPFARLVRGMGLVHEEAEVFSVLCSVELEPRRQKLAGYLQDDVTLRHPTLHTLARMFPAPHVGPGAVAPGARLQRAALVQIATDRPWATRTAKVADAVSWALLGDTSLDPELPPGIELMEGDAVAGVKARLLCIVGPDRVRRLDAGLAALGVDRAIVTPLPEAREAWEALVRWATVHGYGVVLEPRSHQALPDEARSWIERADHLPWALSTPSEIGLEQLPAVPWREIRVDTSEISEAEWASVFPDQDRQGHRLTAEQLRLAASAARALSGDAAEAIRRLAVGPLDQLARRIRPERSWPDLVLAPDRLAQLRELIGRYRHRHVVHDDWHFPATPSTGVVALFSGPSGTGKTLSSEIIAAELGLDLFKIDLSSVVSKYIGETEKNLERIFAAATTTNLVLLFDEADALFGKRSEVQDARDRYANIEVSYLLQRLESYDGLVVLTTNFKKNIDDAFLRRVHVAVEFPLPEARHRKAIWKRSLAQAPLGDVDLDFVAERFEIAGGAIRNAGLTAAFLAAEAGTEVTMEAVIQSVKREYQKLGRLITEDDFGEYYPLVR